MAEPEPRDDVWPYHLSKLIVDDYEFDDGHNIRRTVMSDGVVDQRRLSAKVFKLRRFRVWVKQSDLLNFRAWVNEHGATWFTIRDLDDNQERRVRIIGGRVPLVRQGRQRLDGEAVYEGDVEVEGFE